MNVYLELTDAFNAGRLRANERRLQACMRAAEPWAARWPAVQRRIAGLPLGEAHPIVAAEAASVLPFAVEGTAP